MENEGYAPMEDFTPHILAIGDLFKTDNEEVKYCLHLKELHTWMQIFIITEPILKITQDLSFPNML